MELIPLILFGSVVVIFIRNIVLIKDLVISKKYKKIYKAVIDKDPEVLAKIEEYLKEEKNEYLISKTHVLLMYINLQNENDVSEVIKKIDYEKIFFKNGKYNKRNVNFNSDMLIWTICCLPRLKKAGYLSLVDEKINMLGDKIANHIEYKVFKSACALLNNNTEESKFLEELIRGEYVNLEYDKQLIGATKRIALAYVASQNKEKNLEFADELQFFASTSLGSNLMKDLDIFDIYKKNE